MIYGILKMMFALIFKIFFRAQIKGKENLPKEGAVILAANHMSNWDPPLLATFLPRPVSYMAKQELFVNAVLRFILVRCHSFPVKRGAADRGAIKAAVAELKNGSCLGLFPQGTRSRHGEKRKAEPGVALLASMGKAPVVPAAIIGTDKVFAKGGFFPQLRVIYGKPLHFQAERQDKQALQDFAQKIMDEIYRMIEKEKASA
ncbi:lysophospholipid acyltransferase family protein [Selenomonas sputigena]|uniref:Lysophospholipid acyltransferase family protein n=1 Tax=Selenomonas sputigena TaxID=69823 RepID=A0ABV3X6A2_9FIRM